MKFFFLNQTFNLLLYICCEHCRSLSLFHSLCMCIVNCCHYLLFCLYLFAAPKIFVLFHHIPSGMNRSWNCHLLIKLREKDDDKQSLSHSKTNWLPTQLRSKCNRFAVNFFVVSQWNWSHKWIGISQEKAKKNVQRWIHSHIISFFRLLLFA